MKTLFSSHILGLSEETFVHEKCQFICKKRNSDPLIPFGSFISPKKLIPSTIHWNFQKEAKLLTFRLFAANFESYSN